MEPVSLADIAGPVTIGRHLIQLDHGGNAGAGVHLHHDGLHVADQILDAACLPPLIDLRAKLVKEIGVFLVPFWLIFLVIKCHQLFLYGVLL